MTVEWSSPGQPWRYDGEVRLVRDGVRVRGTIDWRLLAHDPVSAEGLAARIGERAIETVAGVYDTTSRALLLESTSLSDETLIGWARYRLNVLADGAVLGSTAGTDGAWDGVFDARPANPPPTR